MDSSDVKALLDQLKEKKLWCKVLVIVQAGKIEVVDMTQTIKERVSDAVMLVQK